MSQRSCILCIDSVVNPLLVNVEHTPSTKVIMLKNPQHVDFFSGLGCCFLTGLVDQNGFPLTRHVLVAGVCMYGWGARCNRLKLIRQPTQAVRTSVLCLFRVEVTWGVLVGGVGGRGGV